MAEPTETGNFAHPTVNRMPAVPTVKNMNVVRANKLPSSRFANPVYWLIPVGVVIIIGIVLVALRGLSAANAETGGVIDFHAEVIYVTEEPAPQSVSAQGETQTVANTSPEVPPPPGAVGNTVSTTTTGETTATLPNCTISTRGSANVNVRSGPTLDYSIVANLPIGTQVNAFKRTADGWYQVDIYDGLIGWVAGSVVDRTEGCGELPVISYGLCTVTIATTGRVNVRSGAGLNHGVLVTIRDDVTLLAEARSASGWYQINISPQPGWIYSDIINLNGACDTLPLDDGSTVTSRNIAAPTTTTSGNPGASVIDNSVEALITPETDEYPCVARNYLSDSVNLRGGPGMNYDVTGQMTSPLPVDQQSDNGWFRLGTLGWAFAGDLALSGACDDLPRIRSADYSS